MKYRPVLAALLLGCTSLTVLPPLAWSADAAVTSKTRTFRFNYAATLSDLPAGTKLQVWLPVPQSNEHQTIETLSRQLPAKPQIHDEPKYGNRILYFETKAPTNGRLTLSTPYLVRRHEVRGLDQDDPPAQLSAEQRRLFLASNTMVPLGGKPLELLKGLPLPTDALALGRILYDRVDDHVRYDKSQPGYGNGDVLWVCDSRFGNCTDFHSLFISLARSQGVPSRFEIGFPIPPQRGKGEVGGYHCWAFFHAGPQGWVPIDISEADKAPGLKDYYFGNLTEDRVTFSTGRDIDLVPQQAGEPLNFFVYPYVEMDGQPLPREQIGLEFAYEDVQID